MHALLTYGHAGKFVAYYYNNKLTIDDTIKRRLVDYVGEEAKRNLQSLLTSRDYDGVAENTTHSGGKTYTKRSTVVAERNAVN